MVSGGRGVVLKASCWVLKEQPWWFVPGWGWVTAARRGWGLLFRLPGAICHQTAFLPGIGLGCGWWVWVVVGLLFENCIVDASIFVVKLLRADGGCLGTGSR